MKPSFVVLIKHKQQLLPRCSIFQPKRKTIVDHFSYLAGTLDAIVGVIKLIKSRLMLEKNQKNVNFKKATDFVSIGSLSIRFILRMFLSNHIQFEVESSKQVLQTEFLCTNPFPLIVLITLFIFHCVHVELELHLLPGTDTFALQAPDFSPEIVRLIINSALNTDLFFSFQ